MHRYSNCYARRFDVMKRVVGFYRVVFRLFRVYQVIAAKYHNAQFVQLRYTVFVAGKRAKRFRSLSSPKTS